MNRDLGEGKEPSALEKSSNYMIKLPQSKMEGIQRKVLSGVSIPRLHSHPIVWTWGLAGFRDEAVVTEAASKRTAEEAEVKSQKSGTVLDSNEKANRGRNSVPFPEDFGNTCFASN